MNLDNVKTNLAENVADFVSQIPTELNVEEFSKSVTDVSEQSQSLQEDVINNLENTPDLTSGVVETLQDKADELTGGLFNKIKEWFQ